MTKFALLFLLALFTDTSATGTGCKIECESLPLVPPRWGHNGREVSNLAQKCVVKDKCNLDINDILVNKTTHDAQDPDGGYISIDLHITCLDQASLEFTDTRMLNHSILATIRHEDCDITWESLAYLGTRVHLLHIETIVTPQSPPPPPQLPADSAVPGGLKEISLLQLTFVNITDPLDIEPYLMTTHSLLPSVGSLSIQCFEGDRRANHNCTTPVVNFNHTKLPDILPNLQALTLTGVFPLNTTANLSFPWNLNSMDLPLNLTHSKFKKQLYSDGFITQKGDNKFSRDLVVAGNMQIDISQICPYERHLNVLSIRYYGLRSIPADCFTSAPGEKSQLFYIDLSRNYLTELPPTLFGGLESLTDLYLAHNPITKLEIGTFDDLSKLRTLSMDYNDIRKVKNGTFTKLISLKSFFFHGNFKLTHIEPGSLPTYSHNLTFIDLRWCNLLKFPVDCVTLPNLDVCDCDHNVNLSIKNLMEIISYFDPVRMYLVQPLAYYGGTYSHSDVAPMHETDQSGISLRDCAVTNIDYNSSWPIDQKKQLAAFLSFFQISLGKLHTDAPMLQCDCNLYDLQQFVYHNQATAPVSLLSGSKYSHALLLSASNFQTWKCHVHPVLMLNFTEGSFLLMDSKNFVCKDPTVICPERCTCYKGANDSRLIVDCNNRSLTAFPENIKIPSAMEELIVSLSSNTITDLPECDDPRFHWLRHVVHLNIQHNELTPQNIPIFDRFLRCMDKISYLFLAYNNIVYFPPSIRKKNFKALSITGNKLTCCNGHWMKTWLQEKNETIWNSLTAHCKDQAQPIIQLDPDGFSCPGVVLYLAPIFISIAMTIATMMTSVAVYVYSFELKIILFEKLNLHPFDRSSVDSESLDYDLYLMYNYADSPWATEKLLPGLENFGYRVYVPERDMGIGEITAEARANAFASTHRVLVVVSQKFIDSGESMKEFFHAHEHENSTTRKRYLVLVKLNEKINYGTYDIFKKYMSTNFFVSVKSRKFWYNLRYWLPMVRERLPDISTNNNEQHDHDQNHPNEAEDNHSDYNETEHDERSPLLGASNGHPNMVV